MENIVNYYRILGVSYEATFNEIKEAYRQKVKEIHPDKKNGDAELFKRVKEAYEVLRHSEKRKVYDELLFKTLINHQKKEAPSQTNSNLTVINIGKRTRRMSFSSFTINAALILAGALGHAYLNKGKK